MKIYTENLYRKLLKHKKMIHIKRKEQKSICFQRLEMRLLKILRVKVAVLKIETQHYLKNDDKTNIKTMMANITKY